MKVKIFVICFCSCLSLLKAQNINDSLLLYYPFNGNSNDYSGNNFHGTVVSAVLDSGVSGITNAAYYFNGVNSCINLPNDNKLKPQLPVSLSLWVHFDDLSAQYSQILTTDYTIDAYTGIWLGLNPSSYELQVSYGDGTPGGTIPSHRRTKQGTTPLQTDKWYFVAVVIRGATDMDIYINCENDGGSYTGTGDPIVYSSNPGSVGRIDVATVAPYYFKGKIEELRYWNRALTTDDIDELCRFSQLSEMEQNNELSLNTYPNPASDFIYVDLRLSNESVEYSMCDILGQEVLVGDLSDNNMEIGLNQLKPGTYLLTLKDGNSIYYKKVIKE